MAAPSLTGSVGLATAVTKLILRKGTWVGALRLDASFEELHEISAEVTTHPVEDGSLVSDHAEILPRKVRIRGEVSRDFLSGLFLPILDPEALNLDFSFTRDQDAWKYFSEVVGGARVTIKTTLEDLPDMVVTSVRATRTAKKTRALSFVLEAQQVNIVSSATVQGAPKLDKATPEADLGEVPPVSAPPAELNSVIFKLAQ